MKYVEILKRNRELGIALKEEDEYRISVLSNIVVHQLSPVLEHELRSIYRINAIVEQGNYNNIIQDSSSASNSSCTIIFWEVSNFCENFPALVNIKSEESLKDYIDSKILEIDLLFKNLKNCPLIILNKFSSLIFNQQSLRKNNLDKICQILNEHIENTKPANCHLLDLDKTLAALSIEKSVNLRDFYSSKALYSTDFLKSYVKQISPVICSLLGYSKKALILDCDNTLWEGILGEDGMDSIASNFNSPDNSCFRDIQFFVKGLIDKGIIAGICSKNNLGDVESFFATNIMPLRFEDFVIKKINWKDKVHNIRAIATELNIGLDSLVFVDDSPFEIELVNKFLPEVSTFLLPKEKSRYFIELLKLEPLFFNHNETMEDKLRSSSYVAQQKREALKEDFYNIEDFLRSLEMLITIRRNDPSTSSRISQLMQKTNQFNLTTKRLSLSEIESYNENPEWLVYALDVSDKFGDYGVTGAALIKWGGESAMIDSFLMSCRILGREIEYAFINALVSDLKSLGVRTVKAGFRKTEKNIQVENFYDKLGFEAEHISSNSRDYYLMLDDYKSREIDYIKVLYAYKN